ncbi:MAG: ATP synthase F1 subunit delta [Holosporaceae bacterium]|jgi:F-type H+-transporting ATPase subunit delta|nr:ATP synthase F1 subunit delta [Holosporaceae bacterium]
MIGNSIVERYAKSLYEVAVSTGIEGAVLKQITSVRDCVSAVDNREKFLKKISLVPELGENFISQLKDDLKLLPEVGNFLALLLKNKRLPLIIEICDGYLAFVDKIEEKKTFYVSYATKFTKTDEKKLIASLSKVFDGDIKCVAKKDPSLIGGAKVRFRSKILDYSVKSKLERLHRAIRGDSL